jgi:hypothetical protein
MKKVFIYSALLVIGLVLSQFTGSFLSEGAMYTSREFIRLITMFCLCFIMIHVGYEFNIDKSNLKSYAVDYGVAATAAAFPWIFVAIYFTFVFYQSGEWGSFSTWKETLLAGRFAAPTSAGILFSMLAAAGLAGSWYFKKIRTLAIFDDLDTVLFMIPLKMLIVGLQWQLGAVILVMVVLIWIAWKYLHQIKIPITWPWVILYSLIITFISEVIYKYTSLIDDTVPIHIEVLLPAFVLGCVIAHPKKGNQEIEVLEEPKEKLAATTISSIFMIFVGLSMPLISLEGGLSAGGLVFHVILITIVSNLGKMFPLFCYRKEADLRTRLALCVGMWPRGEVGAGVLILSLSYGIGGPIVTVAALSLALNLILTGVFIIIVKRLLSHLDDQKPIIAIINQ